MRATIYTYPWDLTDEGLDSALNTIAHTAGLNSVSLAQSYHVSTYFLPHNPRRPLYWGEEGALYFQPSAAFYEESHIAPLISNVVDGYAFYNYGLIRRAHLEWIGTHCHLWAAKS